MSDSHVVNKVTPPEGCYLEISKNEDTSKANGDMCNFLPNNNIHEDVVSSELSLRDDINTECNMRQSVVQECDNSSEMEVKSEVDEDDNSSHHSPKDSPLEEQRADPYNIDNEESLDDELEYKPLDHSNGIIKKSSKKKKMSSGPGRGRPRKALVTMYHSQISGDKNTIKIRIKKSNFCAQMPPNKKKSGRRKKHKPASDTDNSDYEKKPKRTRPNNADNDVTSTQENEPAEQSCWGSPESLPVEVLEKILDYVVIQEGCLPTLIRIGRVCRLWRDVSLRSPLWSKADLNYVKEKYRTDLRLHWLILNRLVDCQDIIMGEWKIRDIQAFIEALCEHCTKLKGLNLGGWKGITPDHLKYLTTECKTLERLDISSINSTTPINAQPLVNLSQTMAARLTHLVLAHNKIANFTQIMVAISTNCPNLQLLDLSNIRTFAHNMSLLHIEKLQIGCPKLRVLRITNSQIWLAAASLTEQVASPGFPKLEELSLAGLEDDQTTTSRLVDDDCIERLLKCSTKLRLLDVRGCSKLTDSGLVRVPAWDLEHLFLSACYITRLQNSCLELILQKWAHSLLEVDLAWSTATTPLDAAVFALAEKGSESKLRILNLCGSSVSLEPVKAVLTKCPNLRSINLQSCRALPRGIKRLYTDDQVNELRKTLQDKPKTEQDAQEFLRYLLECLHEDVNRITEKTKPILTEIDEKLSDGQKAQESWLRYLRMDNSKIIDNSVGQLKSTLKCTYCWHCSVTFDPFWDLSLPIPQRTGQLRLSQCLDSFTREEMLDSDEKLTCAKCKERRKCTKSLSIYKFSKILVIHLKRFSPMERFRGKVNVTINFPLEGLNISNYAADNVAPFRYSLYALSNHSGTTYSGHYTAVGIRTWALGTNIMILACPLFHPDPS